MLLSNPSPVALALSRSLPRRFGNAAFRGRDNFAPVKPGLRSDPAGWTDPRHRAGLAAEEQAIRYLVSQGWDVAAHRFRVGHAEIDIVARRGQVVAFIEVKSRRADGFGSPFEAVTGAKRREIVKTARAWMDRHGRPGDVYRFDCIGILRDSLEHLEDAFRPGWR